MVNVNERWAQGASPGDAPIDTQVVPIPADELAREARRQRLRTMRGNGVTAANVVSVVQDLIDYLFSD